MAYGGSDSVKARIARQVRKLRTESGWTQEQLAQLSDLAPRHLQRIEAAEANVTVTSLTKLANALAVDVSELLRGD